MDEARELVKERVKPGQRVVQARVLSDGLKQSCTGTGDTTFEAEYNAQLQLPFGRRVIGKRSVAPAWEDIEIEAFGDEEAREKARVYAERQYGELGKVVWVRQEERAAQGLFGLGRKPGRYAAQVFTMAMVELDYSQPVVLEIQLGDTVPRLIYRILSALQLTDEEKRSAIERLLREEPGGDKLGKLSYCQCGYPLRHLLDGGRSELLRPLLVTREDGGRKACYCPLCRTVVEE
jgi:hypothetical protein